MASKFQVHDVGKYLVAKGVPEMLIGCGLHGSVHDVSGDGLVLITDSGVKHFISFDVCQPSPTAVARIEQWKKLFWSCYQRCSPIRVSNLRHIEGTSWALHEGSFCLRQSRQLLGGDLKAFRMFELCCGGFGGWSRAATWLTANNEAVSVSVVGAVDRDATAVHSWRLNNPSHQEATCMVGNIKSLDTWSEIMLTEPNCASLSAPCQSFSFAGLGNGFDSENGSVLAIGMYYAACHGLQVLLLENVSALKANKDHWNFFLALAAFSGFDVLYSEQINISAIHPMERSRLIVLLVAKDKHGISCIDLDWKHNGLSVSCINRNRWLNIPQEISQSLIIPDCVLEMYGDFHRLPVVHRSNTYSRHKNAVLDSRSIRSSHAIPAGCGMARYQQQHEIPGDILGMIRRLNEDQFRFLHAGEIAVAMGCALDVVLPVSNEHAMMIIGNSISEAHSIIGIMVMIGACSNTNAQKIQIRVQDILMKHCGDCFTSNTLRWDKDMTHIRMLHQRLYQVATCTDGVLEPPLPVYIPVGGHTDQMQQRDQLLQAEAQMHPSQHKWSMHASVGHLNCDRSSLGRSDMLIDSNSNVDFQRSPGVVICWPTGTCQLPLAPHEAIGRWEIMGHMCNKVMWTDGDDNVVNPSYGVGFVDVLFTDFDFHWPEQTQKNHVMIIRVTDGVVDGQNITYSDGETVESLAHAEQVLTGPCMRIHKIHDRFACEIDRSRKIADYTVVVLHFAEPRNLIELKIQDGQVVKTIQVSKGTRLFQACAFDREISMCEDGYEVPWDLPIFRNMHLNIAEKVVQPTVEISPTIEFQSEMPEQVVLPVANDTIQTMVADVTNKMTEQMKQMLRNACVPIIEKQCPSRILQMCNFGPMMGDDEMTSNLENMQASTEYRILGIFEWDDQVECWNIHPMWSRSFPRKIDCPVAFVLHVDSHWIPGIVKSRHEPITIWNQTELTVSQGAGLYGLLQVPRQSGLLRKTIMNLPGFCGFQSLMILRHEISNLEKQITEVENPVPLSTLLPEQVVTRYQLSINKCEDQEVLMFAKAIRFAFVNRQFRSPTSARFHAGGADSKASHAQLKLTGAVASILIAKGHSSDEAVSVGKQLSEGHATKIKGLPTMKEAKAYAVILEACVSAGISLANIPQQQAVRRIQTFFRSQQQKRQKPVAQVDIHQLEFAPKTWMVQNGEFVAVQPTWSPVSRGIACADVSQIIEYASEATILSNEANTAITTEPVQCQHPITSEAVIAPVKDRAGGQALVRLYLTHFGAKKVVRVPGKDAAVSLPACRTIAITVYREMMDESMWQQIAKAPVKTVLSVIRESPRDMEVLQVWSRRWGPGTTFGDPANATSFSFLASVNEASLPKWLSCSGLTSPPVFVTGKKNDNEQAIQSNRVIWCGKNISHAIAATTKLDKHLGVVFKPPASYGLRVSSDTFEDSWKTLKGSDQTPAHVACDKKYILAALPMSISGSSLEGWGEAIGWKIRVLKRFHDNRFLIGTPDEPPHERMTLNGSDVLIQAHHDFEKQKKQIVAGKLHSDSLAQEPEDPWLGKTIGDSKKKHGDPQDVWSRYTPTNRGQSRAVNESSAADDRISKVEQDLAQLKDHIQQSQASNQEQFKQMDSKICAMGQSLKASLQEALSDQSTSLIKTFENLLKSPRARAAAHEDEDRSRSPKPKGHA